MCELREGKQDERTNERTNERLATALPESQDKGPDRGSAVPGPRYMEVSPWELQSWDSRGAYFCDIPILS